MVSEHFMKKQANKKIRTPISIHLKRHYKIQTFLYMSKNNSSANIINSMIHHSKLSFKRQQLKTKTKQKLRWQERSWFWSEGEFWVMGAHGLREHHGMLPSGVLGPVYMMTVFFKNAKKKNSAFKRKNKSENWLKMLSWPASRWQCNCWSTLHLRTNTPTACCVSYRLSNMLLSFAWKAK